MVLSRAGGNATKAARRSRTLPSGLRQRVRPGHLFLAVCRAEEALADAEDAALNEIIAYNQKASRLASGMRGECWSRRWLFCIALLRLFFFVL
jgi:hypothetical protein